MRLHQDPCELLDLSVQNTKTLIRSVLQYQVLYGMDLLSTAVADLSNLLASLEMEKDIRWSKDSVSLGNGCKIWLEKI